MPCRSKRVVWAVVGAMAGCHRFVPDSGLVPGVEACMGPDPAVAEQVGRALGEPLDWGDGLQYRVVELASDDFDPLYVVVTWPSNPELRAYDEGLPVVPVVTPPQYVRYQPRPQFRPGYGIVELQPLFPEVSFQGHQTSGQTDHGGLGSAAAVRDMVLFATNQTTSVAGFTLADIVGNNVCPGWSVLLGASSGGSLGAMTLANWPELSSLLLGFADHESPAWPQTTVGDLGKIWMDQDENSDADGNGWTWDDARNHSYEAGACDIYGCNLDYSAIRWDPELDPISVWPPALQAAPEAPGALYLDNNGDGVLSRADGYGLDLDGDGAVGPDEDFLLLTHWDPADPTNKQTYTLQAIQAALDYGALSEDAWPGHLTTPAEAEAFWEGRGIPINAEAIMASAPEGFAFYVDYSAIDHGVGVGLRPHIQGAYEAFRQAGAVVRYNGSADLMNCLFSDSQLLSWGGEVEAGVVLSEPELERWALPEKVDNDSARGVSTLSILWDVVGPFDMCTD